MRTSRNLLKVEQSRRCFGRNRGTNLALERGAGPPHLVHVGPVAIRYLARSLLLITGRHYKAKRYCPVDSFGSSVYSSGTILLTESHPSASKERVYPTGRSGCSVSENGAEPEAQLPRRPLLGNPVNRRSGSCQEPPSTILPLTCLTCCYGGHNVEHNRREP